MTATGLRTEALEKRFGDVTAVDGLDLAVAEGELLVVLGPSGCGKTTLLRLVAGLEVPTGGRVHIRGRDVTATPPGRRNVSMLFQSYALFPHMTVAENIRFGLDVRDVRKADARERVRAAAAAVDCLALLERRPHELSGGERQRVALARALVREPDVFLFDEPLSNLDAELRVQVRGELRDLHERVGGTTVHVTHDQVEALVLGDRIAVLRAGRLEQVGTPDDLWLRPRNRFVAGFVGAPRMNFLPADGPFRVPDVPPARPLELGVRPEDVLLDGAGVDGHVRRVESVGSDAYVHVDLGAHTVVARVSADIRPAAGDVIRLAPRRDRIHAFDAETGERVEW